MPTKARSRRRLPGAAIPADLPGFTPAQRRTLCDAAGLGDAPPGRRRALLDAVHRELARYHSTTSTGAIAPGVARHRAEIGELLRAAEALLRAFGDLDPETAAVLTDGPGGVETTAWARDLHGLWDRLLALDRQIEAQERLHTAPRRDPGDETLARLIDAYRTHSGRGGDLLTFLRHSCACVSLPLPRTDEKLIAVISRLPTIA